MEGCSVAIERRLVVCARNDCWKCRPQEDIVPESCDFQIMHPLETFAGGLGVRSFDRQTGKTTRLVEIANHMAKHQNRVYFLVMNQNMGNHVKQRYGLDSSVMVITKQSADRHLRGMAPGYVLADELLPEELETLASVLAMNTLVACWYTPR